MLPKENALKRNVSSLFQLMWQKCRLQQRDQCCGCPAGTVCSISSSSNCSHIAALIQQQSGSPSLLIWQSETASTAWQYTHEATTLLPASPTAVSWLPAGLLGSNVSLSLAVACATKLMILCKSHSGSWAQVANLSNLAQPLGDLQWTHTGLPVVTAGTQVGVVSNVLQTHVTAMHQQQALVQVPLAHVELETGGPLPDYAPAALALLVARGRIHAAGQVIRSVLAWLKLHAAQHNAAMSPPASKPSKQGSQLLPDTGLEILLASATLKGFSDVISSLPLSETASNDTEDVTDNGEVPSVASSGIALARSQSNSDQHQASSAAPADHFAFDASAFGTSGDQDDAASHPSALADPYAFDAGTFGTDQEEAQAQQKEPQQPQHTDTSQDPYAFSMSALDTGQEIDGPSPQEQPIQQPASDPFAFDAGAFGFDNDRVQQSQPASAASDPYAFDAGAFGMPSEDEQQQAQEDSSNKDQPSNASTADPFAFNPDAFGFSGEEQPQAEAQEPALAAPQAGNAAADPFAFSPDAFGFGGSVTQVATSKQESEHSRPQVVPAETAKPSAADPFAFDAGAFGMEDSSALELQAQQQPSPTRPPAVTPHASNVSSDDADNGPMKRQKPPVIPQVAASSKAAPARQVPQQQPSKTPSSQQKPGKPQIHRPKATTSSQAQPSPLTSDELQELQQLLQDVLTEHLTPAPNAGQPQSPTSPASAADSIDRASGVLPPGLTAQETLTLLNIAHMLCKSPQPSQDRQDAETVAPLLLKVAPVDWAALDACGQKMVRSVQLATCSSHLLPGKQ